MEIRVVEFWDRASGMRYSSLRVLFPPPEARGEERSSRLA